MKIAVIGAGISGMSTALLLSKEHDVTLYEKEGRIGGHAHTVNIKHSGNDISVDNGFMVFNPERYPNFVAMIDWLGVETTSTSMTFSADIAGQVTYRGNFPNGIFAERRNVLNPKMWKFLRGILRFRKLAKKELHNNPKSKQTIGDFFIKNDLEPLVAEWFLYPMLSAVWSMPDNKSAANFPAISTFTFLNNHKLLDQFQPTWKTIVNGSQHYVQKLEEKLIRNNVHLVTGANINKVYRNNAGVDIAISNKKLSYDAVIFATHADITHELLEDCDEQESKALEKFTYSDNLTILHRDRSQISKNRRVHAAWNYTKNDESNAVFTYNMNVLQHIPNDYPVYVTLNPEKKIEPKYVFHTERYSHPRYNLDTLEGQELIEKLQGHNHTYYVGAHLGYGFHEDGITSALHVAKKFMITPPWQK